MSANWKQFSPLWHCTTISFLWTEALVEIQTSYVQVNVVSWRLYLGYKWYVLWLLPICVNFPIGVFHVKTSPLKDKCAGSTYQRCKDVSGLEMDVVAVTGEITVAEWHLTPFRSKAKGYLADFTPFCEACLNNVYGTSNRTTTYSFHILNQHKKLSCAVELSHKSIE